MLTKPKFVANIIKKYYIYTNKTNIRKKIDNYSGIVG